MQIKVIVLMVALTLRGIHEFSQLKKEKVSCAFTLQGIFPDRSVFVQAAPSAHEQKVKDVIDEIGNPILRGIATTIAHEDASAKLEEDYIIARLTTLKGNPPKLDANGSYTIEEVRNYLDEKHPRRHSSQCSTQTHAPLTSSSNSSPKPIPNVNIIQLPLIGTIADAFGSSPECILYYLRVLKATLPKICLFIYPFPLNATICASSNLLHISSTGTISFSSMLDFLLLLGCIAFTYRNEVESWFEENITSASVRQILSTDNYNSNPINKVAMGTTSSNPPNTIINLNKPQDDDNLSTNTSLSTLKMLKKMTDEVTKKIDKKLTRTGPNQVNTGYGIN